SSFTGNFNGYTEGTGGLGGETLYANTASQQPGYIKLTVGPSTATVSYMQTAGTTATHTYTVNACGDTTSPTVTINQDAAQADPTTNSPINFTVLFSESVTGFATGDVTLSGTAGATTAVVTGAGTTYNVAVSGMTQSGTVIATILAGVAQDAASTPNQASTSTDNTVTYNKPIYIYLPLILKNP